jgi:hypothetical protein
MIVGLLEAGIRSYIGLPNTYENGEADKLNRLAKRLLTRPIAVTTAQVCILECLDLTVLVLNSKANCLAERLS